MTVTAEVTLVVKVKNCGAWGEECSGEQVKQQAIKTAHGRLQRLFAETDCEIVGHPKVRAIFAQLPDDFKA